MNPRRRLLTDPHLRSALAPLRDALSAAHRDRLDAILPLFAEGRASLAAAYRAAFPGKTHAQAQGPFRVLRQAIHDASAHVGLDIAFQVDSHKRQPPTRRECWFEDRGSAERDMLSLSAAETAGVDVDTGVENPGVLVDLDAHSTRPLTLFVSYARDDHREVDVFLKALRTQIRASAGNLLPRDTVLVEAPRDNLPQDAGSIPPFRDRPLPRREPVIGDWDLQGGQPWDATLREKMGLSHACLALLSPAFCASEYIGTTEIPFFRSVGRPIIAVALFPTDANTHHLHGLADLHQVRLKRPNARDGRAFSEVRRNRQHVLDFAKTVVAAIAEATKPASSPTSLVAGTMASPVSVPTLPAAWDDRFIPLALALADEGPRTVTDLPLTDTVESEGAPVSLDELVDSSTLEKDLSAKRVDSALRTLEAWACDPQTPPFFAVLGELGVGKTTTLKQLTRRLIERRRQDPSVPLPIYIDLRYCGDIRDGKPPTLDQILGDALRNAFKSHDAHTLTVPEILDAVQHHGALIIFDGLDEKVVHLRSDDAHRFLFELWKVLPTAFRGTGDATAPGETTAKHGGRAGSAGKMVVSCRSHYFQDVWSQRSMLTGQLREPISSRHYHALIILPFTDRLIREYLLKTLGNAERAEGAIELIASVHNLPELAKRPLLLSLIARNLTRLELARARGERVHGVSLYESFVLDWLERDEPKHSLSRNAKLELMEHLAATLATSGARHWDGAKLERWLQKYLAAHPEITATSRRDGRDVLFEDLRTATFVLRPDDSKNQFRFAHTSLQEYFHARHLVRALDDGALASWEIAMPSLETLDFAGQLLALDPEPANHRRALETLLTRGEPKAARIALRYWTLAVERGYPVPAPDRPHLAGLDLAGWDFRGAASDRPLLLHGANLTGARLNHARLANVNLAHADLTGASCLRMECTGVNLRSAILEQADLTGCTFRECQAEGLQGATAQWHDADWIRSDLRRARLSPDFDHEGTRALCRGDEGRVLQPPTHAFPLAEAVLRDGHHLGVNACAWSPDGRRVLSASDDQTLRVWDALSGQCLLILQGHSSGVRACTWSPDSTRILSASYDKTLCVWDALSGQRYLTLQGHSHWVRACAWSPDSTRILSASDDHTLRVWGALSGQCLLTVKGHADSVTACAWSPDSNRLLSGSSDHTLRLWDALSGQCLLTLQGHVRRVTSCTWSPNSTRILSASDDHTLRIWDAISGECLLTLEGHSKEVPACAWSPNSTRILSASGDRTLRIWDALSGQSLLTLEGDFSQASDCAWSPDSKQVLSASLHPSLCIWDAVSGRCLLVSQWHFDRVQACAWSPDSTRILSASYNRTLRIWDAHRGQCLVALQGESHWIQDCSWSPDSGRILSASSDRTLRIWDALSGRCLLTLQGHASSVRACAWSPDSIRILSASHDKTLRVWDALSGECLLTLQGHAEEVPACAWSPESGRVLSGSHDRTLRVWNVHSGQCILTLQGHSRGLKACAWSPDSTRILSASTDQTLRVWDALSGQCLLTLRGHAFFVLHCAWSPDSRRILSASADQTLRIWDSLSGKCLAVLRGHSCWVRACAWHPDGRHVLSASDDGTLRLWDALSGQCLRVSSHLPEGEAVSIDATTQRFLWASPGAWRYLGWRVHDPEAGRWRILPAEFFGSLPS